MLGCSSNHEDVYSRKEVKKFEDSHYVDVDLDTAKKRQGISNQQKVKTSYIDNKNETDSNDSNLMEERIIKIEATE